MVVIPKSVNPVRIAENLKATEVKLDAEDMKQLYGLEKNHRLLLFKGIGPMSLTVDEIWDMTADEAFAL